MCANILIQIQPPVHVRTCIRMQAHHSIDKIGEKKYTNRMPAANKAPHNYHPCDQQRAQPTKSLAGHAIHKVEIQPKLIT